MGTDVTKEYFLCECLDFSRPWVRLILHDSLIKYSWEIKLYLSSINDRLWTLNIILFPLYF